MNRQMTRKFVEAGNGKSTLSTSPVTIKGSDYNGSWEVTLEAGQTYKIHRPGTFDVPTEEIIGFASPKVWMTFNDDPNPENWSEAMREIPTVITKVAGQEDYYIREATEVAGYMRNEPSTVTPLG